MKPLKFKIPKDMASDLTTVCDLGHERLAELERALSFSQPGIIKPGELRSLLNGLLEENGAAAVYKLLLGLSAVARDRHVTVEAVIYSLSEAVEARPEPEPLASKWKAARDDIQALLKSQSVLATAKALELAYEHDRFYASGKILTDVRPIFNDTKDAIVGAVINQLFKLEFDDPSGQRSNITICMDEDDLEWLKTSCEEAIKKSRILALQITKSLSVETVTMDDFSHEQR